jgi:Family of unknown function (DUF6174)
MKIRVVAIVVLIIGLASCGSASSTTSGNRPASKLSPENTAATERWKSLKVMRYRFHFSPGCNCARRVGFVTVTNGVVTAWEPGPSSDVTMTNIGEAKLDDLPTIDSLLAEAARAEREATGRVEISYDVTTGAPTRASIDWIKEGIDDELGWVISDYAVLP